jgi:HEPN domain-containing protein
MNMPADILYWIDLSQYDLETALALLETKRYLYVGFMCHQSVEKILKAYFIASKGTQPPYIHLLNKLAKESGIITEMRDSQIRFLDVLQPLNIEARYPTYKDEIMRSLNEERCRSILKQTEELVAWIKAQLSI